MIRLGGEVFRNGERTYGGCVLFRTDAKKKKKKKKEKKKKKTFSEKRCAGERRICALARVVYTSYPRTQTTFCSKFYSKTAYSAPPRNTDE